MPLLIEACPTYRLPPEDRELLYLMLGGFARHLLQLYQQHQIEVFPAVAQVVERLLAEGDTSVREAATIGLLEGIQNVWSNEGANPRLFGRHLLPLGAKEWQSLNDFWDGKSKSAGEGS